MNTYQPIRGMHILGDGEGDYVKREDHEQALAKERARAKRSEAQLRGRIKLRDETIAKLHDVLAGQAHAEFLEGE